MARGSRVRPGFRLAVVSGRLLWLAGRRNRRLCGVVLGECANLFGCIVGQLDQVQALAVGVERIDSLSYYLYLSTIVIVLVAFFKCCPLVVAVRDVLICPFSIL